MCTARATNNKGSEAEAIVASSGPEFRILVEVLQIPVCCDQNDLPPEHFQGRNCLSDSAVFFKITSNFVEVVDMSTCLHINS